MKKQVLIFISRRKRKAFSSEEGNATALAVDFGADGEVTGTAENLRSWMTLTGLPRFILRSKIYEASAMIDLKATYRLRTVSDSRPFGLMVLETVWGQAPFNISGIAKIVNGRDT
jgi:hypothetical protein